MKLKEEVKGTNLEFIEQIEATDLTEETKSRTLQDHAEPNKDFSALTITNVSEEEIKEETLSPKENIINDSYSASTTVVSEEASLKEAEPVNNEQVQSSDNKETSKEDQEFRGSQTIVSNKSNTEKPSNEDLSSSIGEVSAKESLKEDKSEDTTLKEEVKGTNLEFIEQIETIDLTEETKSGTLQDYAEPEKDFSALTIANVPDVSKEKIKEETLSQEENIINDSYSASATVVSEEAGLKEAEPENNEQIKSFENKEIYEEDQESRESETAATSTNAEELNTQKSANEDLSSLVGEVSAKEILREDESDATKLKEEVKGTNMEFIEQIEAIDLTEETKSGTLQDHAESNKDYSALTIPKVPEVSEEEIKEESLKQEEKIINDFDSTSVIVVSEEASLKEAELENNDQVKSSDSSPDGKDLATIETEGTSLKSVNIDVKQKEYFNSEVNKDNDILPLVDEGEEKLEHQMEDKAPARVIDNEIELTTGETPLRDEITHEKVKSPSNVQKTNEKSTQKGDESIKSKDLTKLLSSDDGKEGAIQELQKHKDTELHMALELHNEKNSYDIEDEKISKSGETGELAGQTEVCNLETQKDENPSHEVLKTVVVGTCKDNEKAILEQEGSVQNFEDCLTDVVVEKGTVDLEAGAGSQECEPTNSKDKKLLVKKNLESADLGQKLDFVSESVSKDQSDETFPQTNKGQTEESSNDIQDWNSKFVERQIIGQVQHETERKMAMQPQLEAEDHINVSQYAKETITNVIATEEVHEGVEKVDGSESIKEHAIHGESDLKEIHTVSAGDEILEKVKDSGPESTEYLKATDFNEQTETLNTGIEEDPTREAEAPGTKAPEEEKIQDEGSLKSADEDTEEKIKEEIKVQVDDLHEKNDNVTVVAAESSSGEAQMDDKHVKDTSSDESLETIKTEQCPQAEEVSSKKPEKTSSCLVSQLPNMDLKNVGKESVTLDEPGTDEVEETKTISSAVFQSKYHGVEETNKTGQSLIVEKLDADGTEEAIKRASGTVSESKFLGIEVVTEDEITADQTLPTGKLEEQFQTPSSELLSLEQEHGPTIIAKETEAIKTREGEMLDDSSATKDTEEMCLQKEEQLQTLSSTLLSKEQEHGTTTAFKKIEGESTREADNKNINNSSVIKATKETCLEQEEPRELNVSKLGIEINKDIQMDSSNKLNKEECCTSDGATKLETEENEERKYSHALSESEKTGELTRQFEEPSNLSFEISEKDFEPVLDVHSHEVLISSEEKVQDEGIVKLVDVSTIVAEESLENIKEEIIGEVDNSCDKTENATTEVVTAESSSGEPQLHDMSTKDIISHERCQETIIMESSPLAEEVASMKLEGTSSNLPSQLPNMISANAEKEGETLDSPDAHEVEETETTSDSVFESKYQSVKETDETGQSLKVEKLDAADIEEIKEPSETLSKPKALEVEAVSEDGVIADQTLPAGMLSEQLQTLSSSVLSREQEHGTTTTVERTEQERTEEVQTLGTESIDYSSAAKTTEGTCFKKEELREFEVPTVGLESGKAIPRDISSEVQKEESITLDQASKLEPQEKEEIKYADSPSESEEIKELARPIEEASNHNFEISEKAADHVSEVQSHEVLTKSEDISEKHLEAVVINLKTEESQCRKTAEANQKSKNEVSIEGVRELYHDYKEISEEDQESRVSNTAVSSTNLEKVNTEKPANADLSSSVAEVSAKEILKQDESDATKLKEEVKGTDLEFVEQIQAIDLTEETKSGTLQDCGGRNRDFNALTITNVLEEEIKEETLSQEESIIYDSYSASAMVVSEEAGLKEAEPEKNEQIKSFNYKEISEEDQESRESEAAASSTNAEKLNTEKPANEDLSSFVGEVSAKEIIKEHESDATKLKEEVKGTHLEFVEQIQEIDLTEETKSGTLQDPAERNRDFNALTITNVSEEEIKEETLSPEENIINDSYSASAMVVSEEACLKEAEAVNNEQVQSSDHKETSKQDQEFRGSQTIVSNKSNTEKPSNEDLSSSIGEVLAKESLKEDESEDTTLKEEVKGTNLEFIEQIETIDLTEETKSGTLQDCAELEKDFSALTIANVPDVSEEKIKEETLSQEENIINDSYSASTTVVSEEACLKEAEPENNEQIKSFENKEIYEEDQESRESETAASSTNAEELNTEKPANEDLSSSVGEVSAKETLKEDESDAAKLKEEVKGTNLEFIEQIEAIDLIEETKSRTLQDRAESNKDFSALTIPKVPEVSEEEIKEETLKQEEKIINDFDSTSLIVVSEEASLKEAELENIDQVKSSDISPDGKDLATIETEGTSLESVNIDVKPKEYFNSEVNKDNDILPLVDEGGEKLEHQMEDKASARVIDNEIELTIGETPLRDEITHENVKSPSSVQKIDEKSTQKGDESIKSKDLTELLSSDDGKEGAIEEVQEHKDTELHMAPELHNEKNSYDTEDEEISKSGETGELAGQTEICNLETEKDENPSHEALKTIAVGTCKNSEKAILEQEDSIQNFEESLTGVVVEKGSADLEAGTGSHECEPTNSKGNKLLVEKNLESADLGQKFDFVSESVSKDQSDETFPQTSKGQTEESSNDVQDWNSKFVERQIIGQVQHETERKMAMQPQLEAEDHINVSQYAKETITNVIATEEVHEGVEKVDGSESIKEHAIHGESDLTEIHTVSVGDEILEKVKDSGPKSTENLKATDFNEQTATLNTGIEEDPTREEEAPGTKAPEEEKIQDEGSLKPVDEDTEEKIKEEIKVQVDDFHDKNDNATVVAAESSSGEAQMDDKHVKDTSSDESLETIKTNQCPQAEEVGSKKPEKTSSSLVSQLPNTDHKNVEKESVTLDEPNADEVEETKTVFQSKYHGVEETDKTGQSLRVEKLDADGTEEAIKEASGTVSESKFLGIEAITEDEITADQTLPTGKLEEQFQTPSSELLSLEQERGPTIIVKETEAIKTREGEMLDDKKIDDSSATKATEDMCLQKEEQLQTLSSTMLSREQEHGTTTAFKKTEGESTREADNKNINNSSAIKATEETCLEQEEPRELNVSKLGIEINKEIQIDSSNKLNKEECCTSDGARKLGTEENEERKYSHALSESEKTGELTRQIEEPSNISFDISEKAFEPVLDVHSHEVHISSEEKVQDEGIVKLVDVSTTVAEESLENIKEEIIVEVDNSCDKTENANAEMVTAESSSGEPQLHYMSTKDIISHERCQETIIMESSPLAEEVASMKLEETSSNLPSQLPNMISENAEKEGETLESLDAHGVEETETTSDSVFESKYQSVKETDETGQSLKVEKLDATDIEDVKETSETMSKPKALEVEAVSEDGVIADQTLPAGMLSEQLQTLSSSVLSREQEHGTTTTVERTEQESTKEVQTLGTKSIDDSSAAKTTEGTCFKKEELREFEVPTVGLESGKAIPRDISNEVRKEESITLDQASKLEPQEKEEIKYADSPSESEEIKELTRPIEEASNHNFEISKKASDHVSEVQSHEVLTKSEDISEKHLEAVVINLKTEESQCKKTAEANQKSKNEVSIEGVPEDKEVSMDSKSVYPGEETTIESHQGDESKTEEYLAEDTNKTFKATTNVNQHEVFRPSEIIDKGSASESIEKKITAEDRTVEDDNATESFPDEAKGKNVEEAAVKLELEHQSGETNLMKGTPEVITPGEKEAGVEISQGEGTTGFSEVTEINQNIQQLGMTSYAASQTKISEAGPSESTEPKISTGHEDVPPVLQHPIDETLQKVETERTRPVKATEIDAEVRGVECQGEKRMVDSGEKITEESAKFSLSDLMQKSMKENPQVAKDLTKERHPMLNKAEMQNEEAETTQFGKAKTDEEEGDEHKRTDPDSDAPVMVEASKDIDVKVAHKKSHSILSGVGSKVKHSISKVKKAITGKSSHPKTQSPK
ncbi:uncharacterized protein LOC132180396 [Corylus avellana]|uniref:uncharacterized protein LOC132180396 n=1 Tax=Corylus avellana TaxID=13451 RepID=UPI00286C90E7|nr:uncharacterized protein LOC132180396 [Corylus avellana]